MPQWAQINQRDKLQEKVVGDYIVADILIEGQAASCIMDTWSQVTTISERYFQGHLADQVSSTDPLKWLH